MDDDCLMRMTDCGPERPVSWVWQGYVPTGHITVLSGDVGIGKTMMALQVAAMVTTGKTRPFPLPMHGDLASGPASPVLTELARAGTNVPPKCAVILSAGDGVADTLLPRLNAAGADLSRVYTLKPNPGIPEDLAVEDADAAKENESFQLSRDLSRLEGSLRRLTESGQEVGMIVIDTIDQYVSTGDHRKQKQELVIRLKKLAARWNVAVLITTVCSPKSRDRGSAALYQALTLEARSVLTIVPQIYDPRKRLLLPVKIKLTEPIPGAGFSIEKGTIVWEDDPAWITPEEHATQWQINLRNPLMREEFERAPQLRRVTRWLREQLLPGRASSNWIRSLSACHNVAYSTLRRAYKALGCRSLKEGNGQWFWYLPVSPHPACEEIVQAPRETPEGISGITREFTPDNFTSWHTDDISHAIFAGADEGDPNDDLPLGNKIVGERTLVKLQPGV